jgi:hypothetical protein
MSRGFSAMWTLLSVPKVMPLMVYWTLRITRQANL